MITTRAANAERVRQISEYLREINPNAPELTDISDYFNNLDIIKAAMATQAQAHPQGGMTQVRHNLFLLPADEPFFEIDANTRRINVPAVFSTNGFIEKDHKAEIIYFTIDRYYETMDFANAMIRIKWRKTDASGTQDGVSVAFGRDLTVKPDKVTFGWIIERELTKLSGSLTFAIEFFIGNFYTDDLQETENSTVEYSFNTLTASLSIKSGLTIKDPVVLYPSAGKFNFLRGSNILSGEVPPLALPVILDSSFDREEERKIYLDANNYYIYIVAEPQDGVLQYKWTKLSNAIDIFNPVTETFETENLLNDDLTTIDNVISDYYIEVTEENTAKYEDCTKWVIDPEREIYVKVDDNTDPTLTTYVVAKAFNTNAYANTRNKTVPGVYQVEIKAVKTNDETEITNTSESIVQTFIIPEPPKPQFAIVTDTSYPDGENVYKLFLDDTTFKYTLTGFEGVAAEDFDRAKGDMFVKLVNTDRLGANGIDGYIETAKTNDEFGAIPNTQEYVLTTTMPILDMGTGAADGDVYKLIGANSKNYGKITSIVNNKFVSQSSFKLYHNPTEVAIMNIGDKGYSYRPVGEDTDETGNYSEATLTTPQTFVITPTTEFVNNYIDNNSVQYHWYVLCRPVDREQPLNPLYMFQNKSYFNTELKADQTLSIPNGTGAKAPTYITWSINENGVLTITTKENNEVEAQDLYFVPFVTYEYAGKNVDELAAATPTKLEQEIMRNRVFVLRYNSAE